jgi:hypothetical protein
LRRSLSAAANIDLIDSGRKVVFLQLNFQTQKIFLKKKDSNVRHFERLITLIFVWRVKLKNIFKKIKEGFEGSALKTKKIVAGAVYKKYFFKLVKLVLLRNFEQALFCG